MMLAAQLWLGYLAAHPMWLTGAAVAAVGVTFILLIAGADMGEKPDPDAAQAWREFAAAVTSPPAGLHPSIPPAGAAPGPGSPPSPGMDGAPHAPVHAPGPGARNGPPWEPAAHEPTAAPTSDVWGPAAYHDRVTAAIGGRS